MIPGFFQTRSEARVGKRGVKGGRLVSSWRDINPGARHPDMPPTGAKHPWLYILGEAPGETEDLKGEQFIGDSGKRLRELLPKKLQSRIRWDNACRTRPPKNRTPDRAELELYRAAIIKEIEQTKPRVLMGVGSLAVTWALPGAGSIKLLRGRRFPLQVGSHELWFYPVHHPAWILRVEHGKEDDIPGEEWRKVWEEDVDRACQAALDDEFERPHVTPGDEIRLLDGVHVLRDRELILHHLRQLSGKPCAFDIETQGFRPYEKDARLLTVAIGNNWHSWSFEWDDSLREPFLAWLRSPGAKIAHNLAFELEWLAHYFGPEVLRQTEWGDTQAQAYVLDERVGGHSLDFLCRQYFGLALKSKSLVSRKNLQWESLEPLLRYNALDAKFTYPLWTEQAERVKRDGLEAIYKEHLRRIPTAVLTQRRGLAVDQERVSFFQQKLGAKIEKARQRLGALAEVAPYRKRYGKFNPTSPQDVQRLLIDAGFKEQLSVGQGKFSTDDSLLSKVDHPVARGVLALRTLQKQKGTYVDRLQAGHARSYLYADGRMHPQFNTLLTITGRFSCEGPNAQNFPKRKNAEIRSQIVADKGCVLLACDYGQLEARVIAALSGQHEIVQQDIHLHWAERIAKLHPPIFKKRGGDMKVFRSDIKNQLVFPLFYGTSAGHVGAMLELPRHIADSVYEEFWDQFTKVRRWQQSLLDKYNELGYVEAPTGRRRRAPMKVNEIINTPVQGSASDIVVDAMNRLSEQAFERDLPRLQPVMNIHDDLTLCVPKRKIDNYAMLLLDATLTTGYSWMDVPLQVELSAGPNWFELSPLGKFNSDDKV